MNSNNLEQVRPVTADAGRYDAVSELDRKIAGNDERIRNLHAEIGKIYCTRHAMNAEPALKTLVDSAAQLQSRNRAMTDQISSVYGMKKCGKCGAYIDKSSIFCVSCGERLVPRVASGCPVCGVALKDGFAFCPICGFQVQKKPEETTGEDLKSEVNTGPEKKRCSHCGAELQKNDIYCVECGTPVQNDSVPWAVEESQNGIGSDQWKRKCPKCGSEIEKEDLFCFQCGEKIR